MFCSILCNLPLLTPDSRCPGCPVCWPVSTPSLPSPWQPITALMLWPMSPPTWHTPPGRREARSPAPSWPRPPACRGPAPGPRGDRRSRPGTSPCLHPPRRCSHWHGDVRCGYKVYIISLLSDVGSISLPTLLIGGHSHIDLLQSWSLVPSRGQRAPACHSGHLAPDM